MADSAQLMGDLEAAVRVHLALGQPRPPLKDLLDATRLQRVDLEGLRAQLLTLDDAIPSAALQARFRRELVAEEDVVGYARLLAGAPPTPTRIARLELLLTRLLTRPLADGQLELLPEQDFVRVLAAVVGERLCEPATRQEAVTFFAGMAERLASLEGVQGLFSAGLHVELNAFRARLGAARLDPAVLYASLLLDVALANHIARGSQVNSDDVETVSSEVSVRRSVAGAQAAVTALMALGLDDDRLATAAAEIDTVCGLLERPRFAAEAIRRAERVVAFVLKIDDALVPAWLRTVLSTGVAAPETLTNYAAFLVAHEGGAARRQRVEAIALHLLTRRSSRGDLEVIDEQDVVALLARVSPRPLADDNQRAAAAAFFLDAAHSLETLGSFDALFDDGLYMNLLGYRRALGWAGLDPGVLYASVLLDVAITNHMLRHLRREQAPAERWLARAAEEEQKVAEIFQEGEELEQRGEERFETQLDRYIEVLRNLDGSITLPSGDRTFSRDERKQLKKRALRNAALLGVLAVLLFVAASLAFQAENTLNSLSPARLSALSEHLKEGHFSEGEDRVFLGQIDTERWQMATEQERKEAAETLARRLSNLDIQAAVVSRGEVPVIQIEGGRVLMVDQKPLGPPPPKNP